MIKCSTPRIDFYRTAFLILASRQVRSLFRVQSLDVQHAVSEQVYCRLLSSHSPNCVRANEHFDVRPELHVGQETFSLGHVVNARCLAEIHRDPAPVLPLAAFCNGHPARAVPES